MKALALDNTATAKKPEAGEIWLAKFSFEESDVRYKVRPVLVLESRPFGVKAAFCGVSLYNPSPLVPIQILKFESSIML